ncbi:ABC transporter substrate-binding protein [Bradyrhizobium sp.]|uniref:ABC transporter substrate-binding protein n=1 Tax=Bradyrhizobium sp. TaxID=376 RepID=UPI002C8FA820|nr:ABC transporter substrate-binding protein [Bradyrhizobium sp.]HWX60888.1 ABC transporter substrate-binding protein [Bradyrhizobium sp.]
MTSIRTRKLVRRSVLKGLGATAALAVFPHVRRASAAEAIEQASFEIAGVRDPQLGAQLAIAEHYGYFKDEGLTVTIHWNQSGADTLTVMAGGSQPIGVGGAFTQIVFSGQKLPIRAISALADIAPTQGFALSPDVKLTSPKELEGKKLAWTQGNSQILILAKLAKVYGFDMKKVTLVNMNPSEGVVAASKGDVDGLLGWQPNLYRLIQLGGTMYTTATTNYMSGKPEEYSFADRLQYNNSLLHAAQDWIDHKPNTLKALLRVVKRATETINADRANALQAMQKILRIDPEPLAVMAGANQYGMAIDDKLITTIEFVNEWALSIKRIPNPVTPEDALAPELLAAVDPSLVTWKPKAKS